MMHKPTLFRERAIRYDEKGQIEMITNLDKVYTEVDIWGKVNHELCIILTHSSMAIEGVSYLSSTS